MSPPIPAGPATVILTHLASLPAARGVALAFPADALVVFGGDGVGGAGQDAEEGDNKGG